MPEFADYGNTKTPSMHRRLGSATLSQLAFPGKGNPNFSWEKSHWDNTVVKSITKKQKTKTKSKRCVKGQSLLIFSGQPGKKRKKTFPVRFPSSSFPIIFYRRCHKHVFSNMLSVVFQGIRQSDDLFSLSPAQKTKDGATRLAYTRLANTFVLWSFSPPLMFTCH